MAISAVISSDQVTPSVSAANLISATCLISAAALAPWPFATVQVSFVALWCGFLAVSLATASVQKLEWPRLRLAAPAVLFVALYCAVVLFQTIPDALFHLAHPVWSKAEDLLRTHLPHFISVNPYQSW